MVPKYQVARTGVASWPSRTRFLMTTKHRKVECVEAYADPDEHKFKNFMFASNYCGRIVFIKF